ncbi:MAG: hypothetical protein INQ03_23930 [Candidatus Heimdallarchaeota archaeon]|nr:hypothetical protein [Candidatus Heimdallarchaeota archaeon]
MIESKIFKILYITDDYSFRSIASCSENFDQYTDIIAINPELAHFGPVIMRLDDAMHSYVMVVTLEKIKRHLDLLVRNNLTSYNSLGVIKPIVFSGLMEFFVHLLDKTGEEVEILDTWKEQLINHYQVSPDIEFVWIHENDELQDIVTKWADNFLM